MPEISPVGLDTPQGSTGASDLRDLDLDQFLQLLIAELQNQDPLNPLDNSEILQQIGQIREIGATNLLTETLQTVLEGQNLTTASSMIGKNIIALADDGEEVEGIVERVSIDFDPKNADRRTLRVHVGEESFQLQNVRELRGDNGETVDATALDESQA